MIKLQKMFIRANEICAISYGKNNNSLKGQYEITIMLKNKLTLLFWYDNETNRDVEFNTAVNLLDESRYIED